MLVRRGAWQARGARPRGKDQRKAAELALYQRLALDGAVAARSDLTVAEVLDLWLAHCKQVHKAITWLCHRSHCEVMAESFGALPLAKLTPGLVQRFLVARDAKRKDRPLSASTRRAYIRRLKSAIKWCHDENLLPRAIDPVRALKMPPDVRRSRTLTRDERVAIEAAAPEAFRVFLAVLGETGARPHVIADLEARHVNFAESVAVVESKGAPYRVVLTARVAAILAEQCAKHPTGPLIPNCEGERWSANAIRCQFRRIAQRTGIEGVTAYAYRHSYATDALEANVNPAVLAVLLNHKSLDMIMKHYSHLAERRMAIQLAAEDAARAVRGAEPAQAPAQPAHRRESAVETPHAKRQSSRHGKGDRSSGR